MNSIKFGVFGESTDISELTEFGDFGEFTDFGHFYCDDLNEWIWFEFLELMIRDWSFS